MKNKTIISLLIMLFGALFITLPVYLLPVCDYASGNTARSTSHMTCFWTARAEIGIGAVIMVIGLLSLFVSVPARFAFSLSLSLLSVLALAIPTVLIGMCGNTMMLCRIGTLPGLVLLSGSLLIVSLINAFYLYKIR